MVFDGVEKADKGRWGGGLAEEEGFLGNEGFLGKEGGEGFE